MWDKCKAIIQENAPSRSIDFSNIENLKLVERGDDRPLLDKVDDRTLALNIDALSATDRNDIISEVTSTKRTQGRFFGADFREFTKRTERTISNAEIRDCVQFFEDYISGPHLELIERSLVVNQGKFEDDIAPGEMDGFKRDISDDYARSVTTADYDIGYTAIHLASAGYFDNDEKVRRIFEQVDREYEDEPIDYQSIFEDILDDSPFLIMVGSDDSMSDVISDFVRRIEKHGDYKFDVEFVDGRAFGAKNRAMAT